VARFIYKPTYTLAEFRVLWNAYIDRANRDAADEGLRDEDNQPLRFRPMNRDQVRRLLRSKGLLPNRANGRGVPRVITFDELNAAWPELVNSMILLDAYERSAA
jgi:hypothetical protein